MCVYVYVCECTGQSAFVTVEGQLSGVCSRL